MKKTLLTAIFASAFAASAFAGTSILDEASYTLSAPITLNTNYIAPSGVSFSSVDGTREQFTLTTVFDWSTIQSKISESVQGAVQIHASDTGKTGFGFYEANDMIVASGMNGSDSYVNSGDADIASFVSNDKLVLTMVITNDGGTLYGFNANSSTLVTLASSTNWKYGTTGDYNKLWFSSPMGASVDSVYVFNTKSDADKVLSISQAAYAAAAPAPTPAVPEPATATLSLLALAGLAARRRRK